MDALEMSADELVSALLTLAGRERVCLLDSCGVGHLGSHLLIAGIEPIEVMELSDEDVDQTLSMLDEAISSELASVFTMSYDFGLKLLGIAPSENQFKPQPEPDIFYSLFDVLIVHDYDTDTTSLVGDAEKFDAISRKLRANISDLKFEISNEEPRVTSNFTKNEYLAAIETIKERIRRGDTYQTNLTQQLTAQLSEELSAEAVFYCLRRDHPAPFSAFIQRKDSTVVSASPERFFNLTAKGGNTTGRECADAREISTSPIKGTRARGSTPAEDHKLRNELLTSPKDRAENTMIVDLLRNDLGRICEYGSVRVEKLCDLEEHPTLFHLVSTISGDLRKDTKFSDILKAVFPCGSITGAPKISTMRIIDEIETVNRGLSMGAIGYYIPSPKSDVQSPTSKEDRSTPTLDFGLWTLDGRLDLSVAIRTMVIRDGIATFNVGGGIVIDSDPQSEYEETLIKGKALLNAIGARPGQYHLR